MHTVASTSAFVHTPPLTAPTRRRALVTGGAGFVGASLCRALLADGYEVYVVDNGITGRSQNITELLQYQHFHFYPQSVNSSAFLRHFLARPVEEIFHLACPTGVPNITLIPLDMIETCSRGTLNVMEIARQHKASVIFTSSCEVYGQPEVCPQHADYTGNVSTVGPRSPYEEGKRFSETIVATYARSFGVSAKIVRIFNTYGPYMSPTDQRVMPQFLHNIRMDEPLRIYGDGSQTRTFLYVDDNVRGLRLVMQEGKVGTVYNLGGVAQVTIRELADLMIELTGHGKGIAHEPHFIEDHTNRLPDTGPLRGLGWEQKVGLAEGLQRMISFFREKEWSIQEQERVAVPV